MVSHKRDYCSWGLYKDKSKYQTSSCKVHVQNWKVILTESELPL